MTTKTFVGFGFGPIQSALFLYEAFLSKRFSRFVIAEVDAQIVQAVRSAGGAYALNIARPDRIDQAVVSGVELYNPSVSADRLKLLDAIAQSDEMATSLPSVAFYDTGGATSVARLLADGLSLRASEHPAIVYAAENHNHAAELLLKACQRHCSSGALRNVQMLNTVIGKMSGVITDAEAIETLKLAKLTPNLAKAVLVEEFNRILISEIVLPGFIRGIKVFIEKSNLLPFEEAKLYSHNAIHALLGCLAARRGLSIMSEASGHSDIMRIARAAFLDECGTALIHRHSDVNDPLFMRAGFDAYADDLLARMVRPTLNDSVHRVIRDLVRKLGWEDRFYGTMRIALGAGIRPVNLARGAAAAIRLLAEHWDSAGVSADHLARPALPLTPESTGQFLRTIWSGKSGADAHTLIALTWEALSEVEGV